VDVDVEAVVAARALRLQVIQVVPVAVAVVARVCLLSIEPGSPEEYALFIGLPEPVIAVSTAHSSTMRGLGYRIPRPPHGLQITPPIFSLSKGWPLTMAPS